MEAPQASTLFRQQAVAHSTNNLLGKVLVVPKPSALLVSILLCVWLVLAGIWLNTAQYAKQVTVRGWLEPAQGATHHVATLQHGFISEILVSPGDFVVQGQPLVKLKADKQSQSGQSAYTLIAQALMNQKIRLSEELVRLKNTTHERERFLQQQQKQTQNEQRALKNIVQSSQQQFGLANQYHEKIDALYRKGWASEIDLHNAKKSLLTLNTDLETYKREEIKLNTQLASIQQELRLLPNNLNSDLADIKNQLENIIQQQLQLESNSMEVVTAKVTGTISDIYASVGKTNVSEPLLTVIPKDSKLIAMLPLPTHAAGFVQSGQSLALRYDAYPHEKFGLYNGIIHSMSDTILLPNELPRAAVPLDQPTYMVKAVLNQQSISAYGEQVALKSGQTFSADIKLGERTFVEWLFAPLMSLKGRL